LAAAGCGYWYWRRKKKKSFSPAPSSHFVQGEGIPNNEPGTGGELQEAEESGNSAFMQRVTELINKNIDNQDYNVENLATDLGMSRMNMYRKFQAYGEVTPSEYIRTLRLQRAADLLLHSDKSVSEIAYAVGFTSPQYFTKCFKEDYGTTPKKYKNNPGKA
jgi:transcriptional regulator GlxA family with amidase domain